MMRLTVRSAFIAPRVFSLWLGRRFGGTAIVYIHMFMIVFMFQNTYVYLCTIMAEGGYDPTDPTTEKTPLIPDTGDDDDDTDLWNNIDLSQIPVTEEPTPGDTDSTQPFEPGAASTPASEQVPMSTRTRLPPEQQGSHTEETSFITGDTQGRRVITGDTPPAAPSLSDLLIPKDVRNHLVKEKEKLRKPYPNFDESQKPLFLGKQERNRGLLVAKGKGMGTELRVFNADGSVNQIFARTNSDWLGPTAKTLIAERDRALSEEKENLRNAERDESRLLSQHQQATNETTNLNKRLERTRARIAALEEGPGSIEEHRAEIDRLKTVESNLKTDLENLTKEAAALTKQQAKQQAKVVKLKAQIATKAKERNKLQAGLDSTKPLDELKQKADELNQHITEDLRIIEDENTSPSDRAAARERLAVNNEELEGLNEEIEVRERQRPLLERVKEIFKKYGWTLQAVVLAVGVVLSALALAGLNGLKAGTKAVGQGLKAVGQKLGSLLPGLIRSIVSFIFKAAGQVLSFLGEHAWLLILAVVAFFMERLLKKRRTQ